MRVEIDAARLLALEVAAKKGRGESARESVLKAKLYATEMAEGPALLIMAVST